MKTTFTFTNLDTVITARNKREEALAMCFIHQLNRIVEYMQDKDYALGRKLKNGHSANWVWEELHGQAEAMFFMDMIPRPLSSVTIARACRRTYNETASYEDRVPDYLI